MYDGFDWLATGLGQVYIIVVKGEEHRLQMHGCALAYCKLPAFQIEPGSCSKIAGHNPKRREAERVRIRERTDPASIKILHLTRRVHQECLTSLNNPRIIIKLKLNRIFTCILCL